MFVAFSGVSESGLMTGGQSEKNLERVRLGLGERPCSEHPNELRVRHQTVLVLVEPVKDAHHQTGPLRLIFDAQPLHPGHEVSPAQRALEPGGVERLERVAQAALLVDRRADLVDQLRATGTGAGTGTGTITVGSHRLFL